MIQETFKKNRPVQTVWAYFLLQPLGWKYGHRIGGYYALLYYATGADRLHAGEEKSGSENEYLGKADDMESLHAGSV